MQGHHLYERKSRPGSTSARSATTTSPCPARERINQLLDEDSFEEWFTDLRPCDPLGFKDRIPYAERLEAEQAKTGMPDAAVVGKGFIRGRPVVFGVTDFRLHGRQHGLGRRREADARDRGGDATDRCRSSSSAAPAAGRACRRASCR